LQLKVSCLKRASDTVTRVTKLADFSEGVRAGAPAAMLETRGWPGGYALLDSGNGRKLERWGALTLVRPETQALWTPTLTEGEWAATDAVFDATLEDDEHGRWRVNAPERQSWTVPFDALTFECRFTSFRHVGLFPEQAPHWTWMEERIRARRAAGAPFRLLNLFGYTGAASLIAAAAGAEVCHVDASKKAIEWARANQAASKLEHRPVRWICDDATKFAEREARRANRYDGIILDPPKFGRGPNNEKWELFDRLPALLATCGGLLSDRASFLILTAYAVRLSYLSLYELMRDATRGRGGAIAAGELIIREQAGGRFLSTSLYARWAGADLLT
jgi:23S rRNA (cytosine1962-C5)-methyltransferase